MSVKIAASGCQCELTTPNVNGDRDKSDKRLECQPKCLTSDVMNMAGTEVVGQGSRLLVAHTVIVAHDVVMPD